MSRPPKARDKVLDAFEHLLNTQGERAATLDATAREAGVSKGGLLYHFGSKDALEAGLIERLDALVGDDIASMQNDPEGPVARYLRSSVAVGDDLDRTLSAVARLAHAGSEPASSAVVAARDRWVEALRPVVADQAALDLVMLVSDGIYFNHALDTTGLVPAVADMDALIALIARLSADTPD